MNLNPATLAVVIGDLVESLVRHGHPQDRAAEQPRRQRPQAGAPRAVRARRPPSSSSATGTRPSTTFTTRSSTSATIMPARWRPRWPWPTARSWSARNRRRHAGGGRGPHGQTRFEAVNRGWVSITRPWHLLTTNAGAGNPHAATAEKGRRLIEVLVDRLAGFLVELSAANWTSGFRIEVLKAHGRTSVTMAWQARKHRQ